MRRISYHLVNALLIACTIVVAGLTYFAMTAWHLL